MGSIWGRKAKEVCKRLSKCQLWEVSEEYEHTMKVLKIGQCDEGAPAQTC